MTATGSERIHSERVRQIITEGWGAGHDDVYLAGQLILAAVGYAVEAIPAGVPIEVTNGVLAERRLAESGTLPSWWPWHENWWKPSDDPIRNLEKAGALIAAEIDRLLRRERAEKRCCKDNVPELSFTRPQGEAWQCPVCDRWWAWDDAEAEGGAWWPFDRPTESMT